MKDVVLELDGIVKQYGKQTIINDLSIQIERGAFVTLLGPSGCGKTTVLRIVAGLETANAGRVLLNGQDVTKLEPDRRSVNTVFQNYALFPHMNVFDNVAYGLRIRRVKKPEIRARVAEIMELVEMAGYEKRMPHQLSGGQRQRVAIARALINRPEIVLLDEPLGALDLKLRRHMQAELKRIQKKTGVTFVYVTHDQEEALDLSDCLAIMRDGVLEQVGAPEEVYNRPESRFVAEFVGTRNLFEVVGAGGGEAMFGAHKIEVAPHALEDGERVVVAVHADRMRLSKEAVARSLPGVVTETAYIGSQIKTRVSVQDMAFEVIEYNVTRNFAPGDAVFLHWDAAEAAVICS